MRVCVLICEKLLNTPRIFAKKYECHISVSSYVPEYMTRNFLLLCDKTMKTRGVTSLFKNMMR